MRRYVAGVRTAAHDVGRPHQYVHTMLARGFSRFEGGGKFGDHAAKLVRFQHMIMGGIIMARQRNLALTTHLGNRRAIGL